MNTLAIAVRVKKVSYFRDFQQIFVIFDMYKIKKWFCV